MKLLLSTLPVTQIDTECLVVLVLDGNDSTSANKQAVPLLQTTDPAVQAVAQDLIAMNEITGKAFETILLHKPAGLRARRLLFLGGGKLKNFSVHELRKAAGAAVRFLKGKNLKSFTLLPPDASQTPDAVRAIVEGAVVADFDPDYYRSDRKDLKMDAMSVVVPASSDQGALAAAVEEGRIIAESQNFTRDLVNEPGNRMTPTMMGDRAAAMCKEVGLKCEVHGPDKIKELKMGAFWSVAQGSDEEPRLIVMRYEPAAAPATPVIGLVGKGITFDSGGISIKPSDGMEKMKYDMAGGAAMIGAMRAIALLKPNVRVIGIVCASENLPSGKAQKPGDVQIAMNGKSIEVINTDAEGRLVLADGLCYARELGATHLVDAATLTGACVVALGHINAGVFANDDAYYETFASALQNSGEKFWRLPVDAEYTEMIRSEIADIKNTGGRWGGAVTAAMFLKEFVEDKPWLHLDIAGAAWIEDSKAWIAKGPSGIAVRTLVELVRNAAAGGVK